MSRWVIMIALTLFVVAGMPAFASATPEVGDPASQVVKAKKGKKAKHLKKHHKKVKKSKKHAKNGHKKVKKHVKHCKKCHKAKK
ncbi:MAG: hypothetical protein AAB731_01270 [Patescibacteria group bacterium]